MSGVEDQVVWAIIGIPYLLVIVLSIWLSVLSVRVRRIGKQLGEELPKEKEWS